MAEPAKGITFSYKASTVPAVTSITGPSMSTPVIDTSDLSVAARTKISSLLCDGGKVTLDLNFDPDGAVHNVINDDVIAGLSGACVLTLTNGTSATTTYSFTAFPTEFTPRASVGGHLTASVTFDVTGAVSIA